MYNAQSHVDQVVVHRNIRVGVWRRFCTDLIGQLIMLHLSEAGWSDYQLQRIRFGENVVDC